MGKPNAQKSSSISQQPTKNRRGVCETKHFSEIGESCNVCHRVFRDAQHLSKHKRGALCKRLVQRFARKHRKLASIAKKDSGDEQAVLPVCHDANSSNAPVSKKKSKVSNNTVNHMYKPYQCTVCGARFYDRVNVELHLERQHNTTQQLWVEVSKSRSHNGQSSINASDNGVSCFVSNDANMIIPDINNSAGSSTSSYSISKNLENNDVTQCLNIGGNNSHLFGGNERLKCMECNDSFISMEELNEHKRVSHGSLAMESSLPPASQATLNSSMSVVRASNTASVSSFMNGSSATCIALPDGTVDALSVHSSKPNVLMSSSPHSIAVNHHMQAGPAASFVFPSGYYSASTDHTNSMNAALHNSPYMSGPQQQHTPHSMMHHHQDITAHQHNTLLHHNTAPQFHHNNLGAVPPSQYSGAMPISHSSGDNEAQQLVSVGNMSINSSDALMLNSGSSIVDNLVMNMSNNSGHTNGSNNAVSSTHVDYGAPNEGSIGAPQCEIPSVSVASMLSSQTSSTAAATLLLSVPPASSISSINNNVKKLPAVSPQPGAVKWNMCGECGIKFLDLMNLELHVERKHPHLKILGSVVLGEGTLCYKTGIISDKGGSKSSGLCKELAKRRMSEEHVCSLCNHKTSSLVPMVDHMLNEHYLSGKIMMDAITSVGDHSDKVNNGKLQNNNHYQQQTNSMDEPPNLSINQQPKEINKSFKARTEVKSSTSSLKEKDPVNRCYSCEAVFNTTAEVIRHCIKDKKHTCVICCFVTCSKHELFDHMKLEHHNWNDFNLLTTGDVPTIRKKLSCFKCYLEFKKTGELIEHLKTHGTLMGKCEKCGKQDYNVATVLIHMTTIHPHYMNKLKVSVMSNGKMLSGLYMQSLSGDLLDYSTNSKNSNSTAKSSHDAETSSQASIKNNPKNDLNNRRIEPTSTSKETNKIAETKNKLTKKEAPKVFACSQCKVCLFNASSLEKHLKDHQINGEKITVDRKSRCNQNAPNDDNKIFQVGLDPLPNTRGFKCEECGLVKSNSDIIINHIKKIHISGNLLHMIHEKNSVIKKYPIYIVTPISSV